MIEGYESGRFGWEDHGVAEACDWLRKYIDDDHPRSMKYTYEVWLEAEAPLLLESDFDTDELAMMLMEFGSDGYIYDNETVVPVRRS